MPDRNWVNTRQAIAKLNPVKSAMLLPKLMVKGPSLISKAQGLLDKYSFSDDKFRIMMIHELEKTLPEFKELYEAVLSDILADKPQIAR